MINSYLEKIKNKEKPSHKVCVIGLGYIGLPTSALLANRGYFVHGVDIYESVVDTINKGEIHIVEHGLDTFVRSAVGSGNLKASLEPCEADIFMICVPTPFYDTGEDVPSPNIEYVLDGTRKISKYLKAGDMVIVESTSPVGTTEEVAKYLAELRPDLVEMDGDKFTKLDLNIAYCPERVLPGRIMIELVENDRIVGGIDKKSAEAVSKFYRTFVEGEVVVTDSKTAEMSKLVENSFRDVNIAFANELSIICEEADINVWELINIANRHPRVNILQPGCGVGGHCIAVDPWFIVSRFKEKAKLIRAAREINNGKETFSIEQVKSAVAKYEKEYGKKPVVALMGLAFKPDIDDLRESPALNIAREFSASYDGEILIIEPNIASLKEVKGLENYNNYDVEATADADILVALVAHKGFKSLSKENLSGKVILDFVNVIK